MNSLQRRLAIIAFAALLLKASLPDSSWAQIAMFAGLGIAIWQLRTAVFRACLERLLNPLIFYVCDALCVALMFVAYRIFFYRPVGIVSALIIGMVIALFTLYRYRKIVKTIRRWKEEQAAKLPEQ